MHVVPRCVHKVPLRYSPDELGRYWSTRPLMVVRRSLEVVTKLVSGPVYVWIADGCEPRA